MQLPFLGTVPAPPLPFLQARYITTYSWCGAVEVSSAWGLPVPPPGCLFTHCQCLSQLPGSDPDFLLWISGCPQGIWDFVPWLVPLPLLGMLSFFCLYNFYCPSTPEKFPALTAGWVEAFSWCVRHLPDIIVDFLSVGLCVVLSHSHRWGVGVGVWWPWFVPDPCSVTVSCSICIWLASACSSPLGGLSVPNSHIYCLFSKAFCSKTQA